MKIEADKLYILVLNSVTLSKGTWARESKHCLVQSKFKGENQPYVISGEREKRKVEL